MVLPQRRFRYTRKDTALYALGIGIGRGDVRELPFVFGDILRSVPSQVTVIAWDDTWQDQVGIDVAKVLHGEQSITLHAPLRDEDEVSAKISVIEALDKGREKGAVLRVQTALSRVEDGSPLATLLSTVFARGDGGFGGPNQKSPAPAHPPDRQPDLVSEFDTRVEQALLYRLSGDMNPLHADPAWAAAAGFDRPILHGLCTYGVAAAELVRHVCDHDPSRLVHLEARFSAPVYPGERLSTEIWIEGDSVHFSTSVPARSARVLSNGRAVVTPSSTRK